MFKSNGKELILRIEAVLSSVVREVRSWSGRRWEKSGNDLHLMLSEDGCHYHPSRSTLKLDIVREGVMVEGP